MKWYYQLVNILASAITVLLIAASCTPISAPVNSTPVTTPATTTPVPSPSQMPTPVVTPSPAPSPTPTPTPQAVNHPPVIHYINAPEEVEVSSTSSIVCVATDPDQDSLSYAWSADKGKIVGSSDNVQWVAADIAGICKISVVVTDNNSALATNNVTINIKNKIILPPKIISFTVVRNDKAQYTITPTDTRQINVVKSSLSEITCLVEDPNGEPLNYLWAAPAGGEIIGAGNKVNFFSPNQPGDYYVIVTAINKSGAKSRASVQFHVPCCGLGAFGQTGQ